MIYTIRHRLSRAAKGGTHVSTLAAIEIDRPTVNTRSIELVGKFNGSIAKFFIHDDDMPGLIEALQQSQQEEVAVE